MATMRRSPTPSGLAGGPGWWTPQRVRELERLWSRDKLTGVAIAERLGTTKDAVISKARRLRLERRRRSRAAEPREAEAEIRRRSRVEALAAATGTTLDAVERLRRRHAVWAG